MKLNAGAIIGLIGGGIGAAVGIGAAFMTEPLVGVVISVVMLIVFTLIYKLLIKPSLDYSRIIKTGTPATATILSLQETGTRINDQPLVKFQIEVNMPNVPPYTTYATSVISYLQVSQFQPGTTMPVMVDSKDKMKVVFIRQGDLPANNPLANASPENVEALKQKLEEMQKEHEEISAIGTYSKAIVTKYTNMGINVNGNNPLVTMDVQVLPENEPAFAATVKGVVKETSIPLFQPGEEIFVKYVPHDKTRVTIEHS